MENYFGSVREAERDERSKEELLKKYSIINSLLSCGMTKEQLINRFGFTQEEIQSVVQYSKK